MQRRADACFNRGARGRHIKLDGTTKEEIRVKATECQIGIRDCGFRTAAPIGNRPGPCAGATRANREPPSGINRTDGTAAGADGAHFHHGKAHGQTVNLALRNHGNAPALHHRDIIGCAAHIHRNQIGTREQFRNAPSRQGATRWTGEQ